MYSLNVKMLSSAAVHFDTGICSSAVIKAITESGMLYLTLLTEHDNSAPLNGSLCVRPFDQLFFQAVDYCAAMMICFTSSSFSLTVHPEHYLGGLR